MSSLAIPPGRPPGRDVPNRVPMNANPPPTGTMAQGQPPRPQEVPSAQQRIRLDTNLTRMQEPVADESPVLAPRGLNLKKGNGTGTVPPPQSSQAQPATISKPAPSVPQGINGGRDGNHPGVPPLPHPPSTRPSRPVPPIPSKPDPSRTAPPEKGQTSALLPHGNQGQGQGSNILPGRPGPPPPFPAPSPANPYLHMNSAMAPNKSSNTVLGDQGPPKPLEAGNIAWNPPQQPGRTAGAVTGPSPYLSSGQSNVPPPWLDPQNKTTPSQPRPGLSLVEQSQTGASPGRVQRKPVGSPPLAQKGDVTSPPPRIPPGTNPLRSSPPNPEMRVGSSAVSTSQPAMAPTRVNNQPGHQTPVSSAIPPRFPPNPPVPPPPRPTQRAPMHGPSSSMDSNTSNNSGASATSTTPLYGAGQQNTGPSPPMPPHQHARYSPPAQHNAGQTQRKTFTIADKVYSGGGKGSGGGADEKKGRLPPALLTLLLSIDPISRRDNILAPVFTWVLLAGFVVAPGSFTSSRRARAGAGPGGDDDPATVSIPLPSASALTLTPGNTAAMVVGFACIVAGTFGCAWLALRWRRNYIWLLNKLYLPLVLAALLGAVATVTAVYTQQAGEWSTQAVITVVIEASVLGVSLVLFVVYNYWLLRLVDSERHEEETDVEGGVGKDMEVEVEEGGGEKRRKGWGVERKKKVRKAKTRVLFLRFRRGVKKEPYVPGSVV